MIPPHRHVDGFYSARENGNAIREILQHRDRLAADGEALATTGLLPLLNLRSGATGQELLNSLKASVPALLDSL